MPALNLDYRTATRSLDWKKLGRFSDPREILERHEWVTDTPPTRWLDGIPLGNGDMAAMQYGTPNRLTWLINKGDIWDHQVPGNDSNLPQVPFRQIANWVSEGDWKSLAKMEERGRNLTPRHYPGFQPAAWIVLEPIGQSVHKGFKQSFSMLTGETTTEFDSDFLSSPLSLTHYQVQAFLAADQNVLRIRVSADRPLRTIRARLLKSPVQHLPDPIFRHRGTLLQMQYTFPDGLMYVVGLESDIPSRLAGQDAEESSIIFDDVDDNNLELRVVIACSQTTSSPEERVRATLNVEKPQRYRGAIRRNQQAMEKYWCRSGMTWEDHPELERHWYLSQFLLGASSAVGKQAAGLQGLWNGDTFPVYHGGYRTDLHLQMNSWSAYSTNRLDMVEPMIRLLSLEIRDQMRTDTARHWGWGGIKVPLCFGPHGQEISTWLPAKLWPGGTAWLGYEFLKWWDYSSDAVFLTTIGYSFALECADFLENWLFQGTGERLELFPSFCPNMGKNSELVWAENCTADIALFRAFFKKLIEVTTLTEIREDPRRVERWQMILDRLPDYPVQNGYWADARNVDWEEPHRYLSKMIGTYPLNETSLGSSKSEVQAANETLKQLDSLGWDKAVGFTLVWLAALRARLGHFEEAREALYDFIHRFTRRNGLNSHFSQEDEVPAEIFQIDANLAFSDAVNQLFLQDMNGALVLFPGLEKDSSAEFWGWRTPGGFLVAARLVKGKLDTLVVEATRTNTLKIVSPFQQKRVTIRLRQKSKVETKVLPNKRGKVLEFALKAGQRIEYGTPTAKKKAVKSKPASSEKKTESDDNDS